MTGPATQDDKRKMRGNLVVAAACVTFIGAMVGVTYASVPLYKLFCQVTGFGGATRQVDEASQKVLGRTITVRFDANVSPGLAWEFQPEQRDVTMRIGETTKIAYTAKNIFNTPSRGKASFNVVPELAGAYFNKLECFCFTDTTLKPGQSLDMPVVFFVDPEIVNEPDLKDIKTITLSYTFFPSADETPVASAASLKDKKAKGQLQ
jgi:cytochrome c oxidase assembly protein subunit 11